MNWTELVLWGSVLVVLALLLGAFLAFYAVARRRP